MYGILFILLIGIDFVFFYPLFERKKPEVDNPKYKEQMKKLWAIAQSSMKESKNLRAEKALLTILKFDDRNAAAYNRLGILYAKEQNYDEAIECFEIAQSLDDNASSLHNVGLIYLETGAYEKAAMAFEQALKLEACMPARYLALAKAQEKMGQRKAAIESLEAAYALDNSTNTLRQILAIYEDAGDVENIELTTARIEKKVAEDNAKREAEQRRKRRISRRPKPAKVLYPHAKKKAKAEKTTIKVKK